MDRRRIPIIVAIPLIYFKAVCKDYFSEKNYIIFYIKFVRSLLDCFMSCFHSSGCTCHPNHAKQCLLCCLCNGIEVVIHCCLLTTTIVIVVLSVGIGIVMSSSSSLSYGHGHCQAHGRHRCRRQSRHRHRHSARGRT